MLDTLKKRMRYLALGLSMDEISWVNWSSGSIVLAHALALYDGQLDQDEIDLLQKLEEDLNS